MCASLKELPVNKAKENKPSLISSAPLGLLSVCLLCLLRSFAFETLQYLLLQNCSLIELKNPCKCKYGYFVYRVRTRSNSMCFPGAPRGFVCGLREISAIKYYFSHTLLHRTTITWQQGGTRMDNSRRQCIISSIFLFLDNLLLLNC